MKSYNHKFIKICSSMKVSLLYISIIYALIIILFHLLFSISFTALSAVLQEVVSVTVSTIQYSNAYHSIIIILLYNIHYYKNVFAHNCYYYAYDSNAFTSVFQYVCVIKFHVPRLMNTLMKMASNSRSNLCSR